MPPSKNSGRIGENSDRIDDMNIAPDAEKELFL